MVSLPQSKPLSRVVLLLIAALFMLNSCATTGTTAKSDEKKKRAQTVSQQLRFEITSAKQVYKAEEPIVIQCKIENLTQEGIVIPPALNANLRIYLKHEKQDRAMPLTTKVIISELVRQEDLIKLQPGKSYHFQKTISKELYTLPKKPGQYELFAVYTNSSAKMGELKLWKGKLKSDVVKVRIE